MRGTFIIKENDEETKTLLYNNENFTVAPLEWYQDDTRAIKIGDKLARIIGNLYVKEFGDENNVFDIYMIEA